VIRRRPLELLREVALPILLLLLGFCLIAVPAHCKLQKSTSTWSIVDRRAFDYLKRIIKK